MIAQGAEPEMRETLAQKQGAAPWQPAGEPPLVLTGREQILTVQQDLEDLADACGQAGAADSIDYFLTQPYAQGKTPHLLLYRRPDTGDGGPRLAGAALIHQYRTPGLPLPVFVTEDTAGERNFLAPAESRSALALSATRFLMSTRGARLVVLSLKDAGVHPAPRDPVQPRRQWAYAQRTLRRYLPLHENYQATLDTLGSHTRRNFRLYRRRAESTLNCVFVPQAKLTEPEFLALNEHFDYPVPLHVAQWRYRSTQTAAGGVLAGLKGADGRWLSFVGGRRYGGTFAVDWQMNRTDLAPFAPGTLMRGFLMENEGARGTGMLLFEGGTPHPMQSAFLQENVTDIVASSSPLPLKLLQSYLARRLRPGNFLVQTLAAENLRWHANLDV